MCFQASTIGSDGVAPVSGHYTGLNSVSLAKHNSAAGGSENIMPSDREPSTAASEADSNVDSQISAWNKFSVDSDHQSTAEDGRVWVAQPRYKQAAFKAYTGYDSTGVAHSRHRAPSTATTQSFAEIKSSRVESYSVGFAYVACLFQLTRCRATETSFLSRPGSRAFRHRLQRGQSRRRKSAATTYLMMTTMKMTMRDTILDEDMLPSTTDGMLSQPRRTHLLLG